MSIPAVLYDHVPIDDLDDDGDVRQGGSFYVSSMVHRTSAPQEDYEFVGNVYENSNRKFDNESSDGADIIKDSDIDADFIDIEDVEIDDRPMETIIEGIDFDYVLIPPIPPPTLSNNDDTGSLSTTYPATKSSMRKRIRNCGKSLLKTVKNSSASNRRRITKLANDTSYVTNCLSGGSRALLGPFQFYVADLFPYSIYSSFDWASETVIDGSGNRLILPGDCITLDSGDSRDSIGNEEAGTLIVPAGESQPSSVKKSSRNSSLWSSNTIMVSAYDLLALKHDQRIQLGDDDFKMNCSAVIETATHNVAQQWIRALWKLAERKAKIWYCLSRSYLRSSLQNTGRRFIHSQQYLVQYYKVSSRQGYRSLAITSNHGFGNSEGHDEHGGNEQDMALSASSQILSNQSFRNKKTSDEIINGCDFGVRISECTSLIEMEPLSKRRNGL